MKLWRAGWFAWPWAAAVLLVALGPVLLLMVATVLLLLAGDAPSCMGVLACVYEVIHRRIACLR